MTGRSTRIAWAILAVGAAEVTAILWLKAMNEPRSLGALLAQEAGYQAIELGWILVGALLIAKRPQNRISWLFAWIGLLLAAGQLTGEYAIYTLDSLGVTGVLGKASQWLSSWIWVIAFGPITLLVLWFPTGRPPSPRWRWVELWAFGLLGTTSVIMAFSEDPASTSPYSNPLEIESLTKITERMVIVLEPMFPALVLTCATSLFVRFRQSRGEERQQLKWFLSAVGFLVLYLVADTALGYEASAVWTIFEIAAFLSLPTAAAVAVLKYRLYDIDVIINRALVYGALTASLVAAYVAIVFALQSVLSEVTEDSQIAVAASTLAVAAMFRPLRGRLQSFIDRRFYRSKYDAARTLETFTARLRQHVALDEVQRDVLVTLETTVQPAHASLWLREAGA